VQQKNLKEKIWLIMANVVQKKVAVHMGIDIARVMTTQHGKPMDKDIHLLSVMTHGTMHLVIISGIRKLILML
jgi:hypothetical protein